MNSNDRNQQMGVVSILVTMIMMIVISLIVLGFAQISRTAQLSSLTNQLSTQAYYAAESGINDARADISNLIVSDPTNLPNLPSKTGCGPTPSYANLDSPTSSLLSSSYDVRYTCVLINPTPQYLIYDIGNSSTVIPIIVSSHSGTFNLTLTWTKATGSTGTSCSLAPGDFPPFDQWTCPYPIVRVDLLNANGSLARTNWNNDTATMFFEPTNSGFSSGSPTMASRGTTFAAQCNSTTSTCQATIYGLSGSTYYMRVNTIYQSNSILTITSNIPNNQFSGAEALIDSTGQAQNVLRRILVAVDLTNANDYPVPNGAIASQASICKRFEVYSGYYTTQC